MRLALLTAVVLVLAVPVGWAASIPAGSLSVEDARGTVVLKGKGIVIGRLERGEVEIVDLSRLTSGARASTASRADARCGRAARTSTSTFPAAATRSRCAARDSRSRPAARASRRSTADPDAAGSTGTYAVGDDVPVPLPVSPGRVELRVVGGHGPGGRREGGNAVTSQPQSVLVVEDEQSIASFVSLYLKNAGYGVRAVGTGAGALNAVAAEMPSLIVLDLNLPDMDGIEICRRIRKNSDVPIIMLTARDEDVDKIIGLEVGADDYLTKPFNPRELVARVKSVLRRATSDRRIDEGDEIRHGDLLINSGRREVLVGDDEIQLAPKEFDLLWELLDHRGIVLTRDQLLERVWGYTFAGDTRTVDVHVRQIRRKLGDASPIVTVWGVGYKVASERTAAPTA